jgi:1-acyl-sn-glycerol-3-phosphate acyltransferase
VEAPRFEPLALGEALTWTYRGQVRPTNAVVITTLDVTRVDRDGPHPTAWAEASLWVDGKRMYHAKNLGMRIVSGALEAPRRVLDPAAQPWLRDHAPTWTVPALSMMDMVELLADAAARARDGRVVVGLRDVTVKRWLPLDGPTTVWTTLTGGDLAVQVTLHGEDGPIATGTVDLATDWAGGPRPVPPLDAPEVPAPYEDGTLFHGPAYQLMGRLLRDATGASWTVDAAKGGAPIGRLHPLLLDAATHGIPHDHMTLWSEALPADHAAYPALIPEMRFYGPPPGVGTLRVEARFDGFFAGPRFPAVRVQIIDDQRVWASFRLVEATFPKGGLGTAPVANRRAFLRDRRFVPGLSLSRQAEGETRLRAAEVQAIDWLPGTVRALYGSDDPAHIATADHLAHRVGVHPDRVAQATPLNALPVAVVVEQDEAEGDEIVVRDGGPETLDITPVRDFWTRWFERSGWIVEDLHYGLIQRFVRRVVLADPAGFAAVKGRPVMYLANHQVGVESVVFSILLSGLTEVVTITLAKAEHRHTWLGRFLEHSFVYPESKDPGTIRFFDRDDRESLPRIIGELGEQMAQGDRSVMVHVEGTRSLSCATPVEKMSGAFIDMAIAVGAPVVPVRFVGGLPQAPVETRLEFPLGMGTQDLWIGAPLMPEALAAVPYGARKAQVIAAINALGPANAEEQPHAGDPDFDARVQAWRAESGADEEHATLLRVLQECPAPCAETQRLLDDIAAGRGPTEPDPARRAWLAELAARLTGAEGDSQ